MFGSSFNQKKFRIVDCITKGSQGLVALVAQWHPPMREREFLRWPKYKTAYLNAFAKMLKRREQLGKMNDQMRIGYTPQSVFNWWLEYDILPGQMNWFEDFEELETDE